MDDSLTEERRTDTRFGGQVLRPARATLRPGCTVTLVDLSAGGALVEGGRPLRPGARVHLQFQRGPRSFALAAHVLRCMVWALDAEAGVMYRGALKFESRCEKLWEPDTRDGYDGPEPRDQESSAGGHALPVSPERCDRDRNRGDA